MFSGVLSIVSGVKVGISVILVAFSSGLSALKKKKWGKGQSWRQLDFISRKQKCPQK